LILSKCLEFLGQVRTIKYPPPLYVYQWKSLTLEERKVALKEIQDINKDHVHEALEAKQEGFLGKFGKGRRKDEPKEWRAWSKMYEWERQDAFEKLKVCANHRLAQLDLIQWGYRQQRNFTTAARSCENPKIRILA
jgi:hypothetical protein